ncbi:MAG: tetratricopeptide repeat protein [Cytophagales bacterium]|nr:tetratricopeptide repeat protein [Cytophagales bacterium]
MNELEKDIALLERYIENDLGIEEREIVEQRLASEDDFKKLLDQVRILIGGIQYAARNKMMQQLKDLEQKLPEVNWQEHVDDDQEEEKAVPMRNRRYWLMAAASVVILAVSSIFLFNHRSAPGDIYQAYFETYDNVMSATTRGKSTVQTSFEQAMQVYDQGNYSLAIKMFNELPGVEKDSGVYLYLGNSYLVEEQPDKAIEAFEKALENPGNFENQLQWYRGLGYLQAGNIEKSIEVFTIVKNSDYSKSKQAKEILKKISK